MEQTVLPAKCRSVEVSGAIAKAKSANVGVLGAIVYLVDWVAALAE
jgi:hypothetical protein